MSGGVCQDGLLVKSKSKYIETPRSKESVRLFINEIDNKPYIKNSNGLVYPFNQNSSGSGYDILKKFTPVINLQENFLLDVAIDPSVVPILFVNGQSQEYGLDYTIEILNLKWLNKDFTLETTDLLEIYY